jgi:hypothetical protein
VCFFINWYSHLPFLREELKQFLPDGSFASLLWKAIGRELYDQLVHGWDKSETEYSSVFSVDALFLWVTQNGGLDPAWLETEDGRYIDDSGKEISPNIKPTYSAVEQLAAYGLWLLDDLFDSLGPVPKKNKRNENFFAYNDVIEHKAECAFLAYKALAYSYRILRGTKLTPEEEKKAEQINFSSLGKAGAMKRHAQTTKLREFAVKLYQAKEWSSANEAAYKLKEEVLKYGRTINVHLAEGNAQRTLAEWFRRCPSSR